MLSASYCIEKYIITYTQEVDYVLSGLSGLLEKPFILDILEAVAAKILAACYCYYAVLALPLKAIEPALTAAERHSCCR